jgi:hypothetical protein
VHSVKHTFSRKPLKVFHTAHISNPKRFSIKTWKVFYSCEKPSKVFWKTLGKGLSPKTIFGFPEIHYGFFTLCEKPLWVFWNTFRGSIFVLVKNPWRTLISKSVPDDFWSYKLSAYSENLIINWIPGGNLYFTTFV